MGFFLEHSGNKYTNDRTCHFAQNIYSELSQLSTMGEGSTVMFLFQCVNEIHWWSIFSMKIHLIRLQSCFWKKPWATLLPNYTVLRGLPLGHCLSIGWNDRPKTMPSPTLSKREESLADEPSLWATGHQEDLMSPFDSCSVSSLSFTCCQMGKKLAKTDHQDPILDSDQLHLIRVCGFLMRCVSPKSITKNNDGRQLLPSSRFVFRCQHMASTGKQSITVTNAE